MSRNELIRILKSKGIHLHWFWHSEKDLVRILEIGIEKSPILDYVRYPLATFMFFMCVFWMLSWLLAISDGARAYDITLYAINLFICCYLVKLFLPPKRYL